MHVQVQCISAVSATLFIIFFHSNVLRTYGITGINDKTQKLYLEKILYMYFSHIFENEKYLSVQYILICDFGARVKSSLFSS